MDCSWLYRAAGRYDPERIGRFVGAAKPDIAGCQEIALRHRTRKRSRVHHYLRARTGDHGHHARSLIGADRDMGKCRQAGSR